MASSGRGQSRTRAAKMRDCHKVSTRQVERTQMTLAPHPGFLIELIPTLVFSTRLRRSREAPVIGTRIASDGTRRSSHADVDWDHFGDPAVSGPWFRSRQLPRTWIDKK